MHNLCMRDYPHKEHTIHVPTVMSIIQLSDGFIGFDTVTPTYFSERCGGFDAEETDKKGGT